MRTLLPRFFLLAQKYATFSGMCPVSVSVCVCVCLSKMHLKYTKIHSEKLSEKGA